MATPAETTCFDTFVSQLRGPFGFGVQAGLAPSPALWAAVTKLTSPLRSLFRLSWQDYTPKEGFVKRNRRLFLFLLQNLVGR